MTVEPVVLSDSARDSIRLVPAMRLSPSYTLLDAFGDFLRPGRPIPTARQIGNATQLARQIEMLRAIAGGRPLEVRHWTRDAPHPDGEGHATGCAVDLIVPRGITDTTLAFHAHKLGFFNVIKIGADLVHIEIGEGTQRALSRVARSNIAARLETSGDVEVDADTPTVRMMQRAPIEATQVLVRIAGASDRIELQRGAPQLLHVWNAIDRVEGMPAPIRRALVLAAVGLGLLEDDAYFAFGPRWWQHEILGGARADAKLVSTAWSYHAPAQWGRIGPWQTLRSTALLDGFSAADPWTTTQNVRGTGAPDPETGRDAGEIVGVAQGALSQVDVAVHYAALAMQRLGSAPGTDLFARLRAFYTENGIANVDECVARASGADPVICRIHEVRLRAKEV